MKIENSRRRDKSLVQMMRGRRVCSCVPNMQAEGGCGGWQAGDGRGAVTSN